MNKGKTIRTKEFIDFLKGAEPQDVLRTLPKIDAFYSELQKDFNKTSNIRYELWKAMGNRLEKAYGENWTLYMTMSRLPSQGRMGLMYTRNTNHEFKESIDWILSANGEPSDRVKLLAPASTYGIWRDVKEENPLATFDSMEEILDYKKFNGLQFLVLPQVEIDGKRDSISIQNWFGNNSTLLTCQDVRNPYYDT